MTIQEFQRQITAGIPEELPAPKPYDPAINHAPRRKEILSPEERVLAVRNALRYFPERHHETLAREFAEELRRYGRIYMYRFRPDYEMHARPIDDYPHKSRQAAAVMMMIQNNLDKAVAQHPHELITYGGNGAVFQNWAQYLLTMQYLSQMTDDQTLVMYSGHPMGLFPSHPDAPRVVVTNGMVIPNYSKPDDWERFNALGVSQYGQMTAGSYMYIGPQGIVHGTTITVMNAARKRLEPGRKDLGGMLFVSSGLGGMSGAQPKAGNISGVVSVVAEINPKAAHKRHEQGWVDELHDSLDELIPRIRRAQEQREVVSLAYVGNVVDLWERLADEEIRVDLGSGQTSLHNPWAGGYYPVGLSYEESNRMMADDPEAFRERVQESLRRQIAAINRLTARGMYFFDYGNAFLLESSRAGADVLAQKVASVIPPMCRISWGRCSSTTASDRSVGPAPPASPRILPSRTGWPPRCSRRFAARRPPRSRGSSTTTSTGSARRPAISWWSDRRPVSSMPTAKGAPRSHWRSTRPSGGVKFRPLSCSAATTTTCRAPTRPTARRRTSTTARTSRPTWPCRTSEIASPPGLRGRYE